MDEKEYPMATLKDVANLAGVTVTTVSRMMNGRCNVSEATREKIESAMKELNYHPNEFARSLAKKTSNIIGLIVPSAQVCFFSSLIEHVENHAYQNGCKLMLCISNLDVQKEREYFSMLLGNKVMGIILASHTQNIDDFIHITAPLIIVERAPAPNVPCALMDNYNGGYIAGQHLIEKGCRHLLYFSGHATIDADPNKRILGLRDACREHGLPAPAQFDAPWDQFISMDYDASVRQLFRRHPEADGILASNDIMAASIVRYCNRQGIRVPEQLKVIGYDDTSFAKNCTQPLTTIHQPVDDLAFFAVSSIIRAAEGKAIPIRATFPVHLVERETT